MGTSKDKVIIVGSGIIGLAVAFNMLKAGWNVTLVDKSGVANETSYGNAAGLAYSEIMPLASPAIFRKAIMWMLDPKGPLHIPPKEILKVAPWMIRFAWASFPHKVKKSVTAQAALMDLSRKQSNIMFKEAGIQHMVRHKGSLQLYEIASEFKDSQAGWKLRKDHGIEFEHLHGEQLLKFEPELSSQFISGTYVPGWENVSDPYEFALALAQHIHACGAQQIIAEVKAIASSDDQVQVHLKDGTVLKSDKLVIAAGAWSAQLARQLGDTIPMVSERGYNTTFPVGAVPISRQLIFGGHGFVATPMDTGVRIGGASEITSLDAPKNFRRSEILVEKAKKFLPNLNVKDGVQWMGPRPTLPDTLPVVDRATNAPNVVYAFGHGHLGLTQAAATGCLVQEILTDRKPSIDLEPFQINRF